MPGLIKISNPRRMRVSVLNMMRVFASRFPSIHIFPRSIMAPWTPPIIVMLILVLMLFIPASNLVTIFLLVSFSNFLHLFYVVFQFSNMLSLLLHHQNNVFVWDLVPGSSFNLRCQRIPGWFREKRVSIVLGSGIRGEFRRSMSIPLFVLRWLSVT